MGRRSVLQPPLKPVSSKTKLVTRKQLEVFPKGTYVHVQTVNDLPSVTQTHQAEATDIHHILESFGVTGGPGLQLNPRQPFYGDFSEAGDLQTQFERVSEAFEAFAELPAKIRARFDNDPVMLVQFLEDPANIPEGVEIGLYAESALQGHPTPPPPSNAAEAEPQTPEAQQPAPTPPPSPDQGEGG